MRNVCCQVAVGLALMMGSFTPAQAAHITFDDTDLNTITISAADFEGGFSVNGVLLTSGLGNSGSVTLPDGVLHELRGLWIDNGDTPDNTAVELFFIFPSAPLDVLSGFGFGVSRDNSGLARFGGLFGGFSGAPLLTGAGPTAPQDGPPVTIFPLTGLGITFTPENPSVPEPASLGLLGGALAAYAWARRRRR